MRGEFSGVRHQIIDELLVPLNAYEEVDGNFYIDLFRETIPAPSPPSAPTPTDLDENGKIYLPGDIEAQAIYENAKEKFHNRLAKYSDASSNDGTAWEYLVDYYLDPGTNEPALVVALEKSFSVVQDLGGDALSNDFYLSVDVFLGKYSLRYDLRRPFSFHPTLPGIFANLIKELKVLAKSDANLADRLHDFEDALRDLKIDYSARRIRVCVQAQMNLLEAISCRHPTAAGKATLGEMCKALDTWPHTAVKNSLSSLYGFSSDFSGVRHGKASEGVRREVEMRDLISMSVILAGFIPYLTDALEPERIYFS